MNFSGEGSGRVSTILRLSIHNHVEHPLIESCVWVILQVGGRGLYRTALEVSKLLLSLDP